MAGPGTVVPLLALAALLVVAYRHPRPVVEAGAAALAAAAVLAAGLGWADAADVVRRLAPVVGFLVAVLVVATVCDRAGLFSYAAHRVRSAAGGRPGRLLLGVVVLAGIVTTTLSLDATVVLLAPVVVVAAGARTAARPGAYACLRMANSGSLLLPVSNLTNLLALPYLSGAAGGYAGFAARMAPVLVAVVVTEYVALRWLFRADLRDRLPEVQVEAPARPSTLPVVVVGLMLAGFVGGSAAGVEAWVPAAAAALVLAGWAVRAGVVGGRDVVIAAQPSFAVFVLGLGVVVAAATTGPLGDAVERSLPGLGGRPSYGDLLLVALVATVLANLVTNLSATLLLVPLVAAGGDTVVLAALVGLNVGAGLTYPGSLANLLWRRGLAARGSEGWSLREFHRVSLLITPLSVLVAVTVLTLVTATIRS